MKTTLDTQITRDRDPAIGGAEGQIPCPRRGRDVDADECVACEVPCMNGFHVAGRGAEDKDTVVRWAALHGLL